MQIFSVVFRFLAKIAAVLSMLTLVFFLCGSAYSADGSKRKTFRVGYWFLPGYHEQNSAGERSGYGYEYTEKVAACMGWNIEYVGYDKSWAELLDMLERGEIDLISNATKMPEREGRFDYVDRPMGLSFTILTVKAGDLRFRLNDYANWNGIRVGMICESSRNTQFADFAKSKGFSYVPFLYPTYSEFEAALEKGEVDALVGTDTREVKDEWILEKINPDPIYFMVKKGNAKLLSELNRALSLLEINAPRLNETLVKRYYLSESPDRIHLTTEEALFISESKRKGKVFRAILSPDRFPMSEYRDGSMHGIFVGIADIISKRSGLDIKVVPFRTRKEYADTLRRGDFDIIIDAPKDYTFAEKNSLYLTESYYNTSVSLLKRKNGSLNSGKKAVVCGSHMARELVSRGIKESDFLFCDSLADMLNALYEGLADGAYVYTRTANDVLYRDKSAKLSSFLVYGLNPEFSVGIKRSLPAESVRILGKVVRSISKDDLSNVSAPYDILPNPVFSFGDWVSENPLKFVSAVSLLLAALLGMLFYALASKRRLGMALARACSAEKEKGRFLATMTHEIRTPLNAVIGFSELLKDSTLSPETMRDYIDDILCASNALLSLINDILDLSKLESGRMKFVSVETDMANLVKEVSAIFRQRCIENGIEIYLEIPEIPHIFTDSLRIRQILLNLVGNAVKFTKKGRISIGVKFEAADAYSGMLRLYVSDTGIGISETERKILFEPYVQSNDIRGTKIANVGTGLGLAIVKQIARQLDGDVSLESELGKGSTFSVSFRNVRFCGTPTELPMGEIESPDLPDGSFCKLSLLLVDDVAMNLKVLKALCAKLGVGDIGTASNGREALTVLAERKFDAVLTDILMPEMDGKEFVEIIRADPRFSEMPVFAITGDAEAREKSNIGKFTGVLLKPITLSKIGELLSQIAARTRG